VADKALFAIERSPSAVVVSGEVDSASASTFRRLLLAAVDDMPGPGDRVVLDLTGLRFIDSSGLAELIRLHQSLASRGIGLAIRAEAHVVRLFEITGLTDLLE
jgi:anti-sigma B factor antagonist